MRQGYDSVMVQAAVLTISDSRSAAPQEDRGGPAVIEQLADLGIPVVDRRIVPDERERIAEAVREWIGRHALIVTTGGTGVGPRDVTPEALTPLFNRFLPGFGEIMRTGSYGKTPLSIISRGGAGVAGNSLIVMLPGSPKGVKECLQLVGPAIRHVLKILTDEKVDCQREAMEESRRPDPAAGSRDQGSGKA